MLGTGTNVPMIFDRGGKARLAVFDSGVIALEWERTLNAVSTAEVILNVGECDCSVLGAIRALRHELVIFRDGERVWEGPITRIGYGYDTVTINARDVLFWTQRRVHRGRFATANIVEEAAQALTDGFYLDDVNVSSYIYAGPGGTDNDFTTQYNRADCYYYDAMDDMAAAGLNFSTTGRRIMAWAADRKIGQTQLLRSPGDIGVPVTVIEDGVSLATRVVASGGETFGATTPEPTIINRAINPSLESNLNGFSSGVALHWAVARLSGSWGSGSHIGRVDATPPGKPASNATAKVKNAYNERLRSFHASEVLMHMGGQYISVSPGELISASLEVRAKGTHVTRLGLRLRGYIEDDDGSIDLDDRAFEEGPPIRASQTKTRMLFVAGTVPEGVVRARVEVYRHMETEDPKWTTSDGFYFDKFAIYRGRLETWFDGDSKDGDGYVYAWSGANNNSASTRTWFNSDAAPKHQFRDHISPYYGLVELLEDARATTRTSLEKVAKATLKRSNPPPLAIDVPSNAPLLPTAPVVLAELVAGATVPIEGITACRHAKAYTVLDVLTVKQTAKGESITVTLLGGQVFETDEAEVILPEAAQAYERPVGWLQQKRTPYLEPVIGDER